MDSFSVSLLKLYLERRHLSLVQLGAILNVDYFGLSEPIKFLIKNGYLRIESNYKTLHNTDNNLISPNTPLEITFEGKAALETQHKLSKEKRNEWIRYAITTAIALAAFIKSFFF